MASPTQWTWVWASSGIWWWTRNTGVLQSMGLQRVRHDWATELNWFIYLVALGLRFCTGDLRSLLWHLESFGNFPCGSASKESACNAGDLGSIPGLGRSPGEGKGYPLQYSGLDNSMDCIIHGVTKSRTQLSELHFTFGILWLWHTNSQLQHVGSSSMIRDQTQAPALGTGVLAPGQPGKSWSPFILMPRFHH